MRPRIGKSRIDRMDVATTPAASREVLRDPDRTGTKGELIAALTGPFADIPLCGVAPIS